MMRRMLVATVTVGVLALSACGSDEVDNLDDVDVPDVDVDVSTGDTLMPGDFTELGPDSSNTPTSMTDDAISNSTGTVSNDDSTTP